MHRSSELVGVMLGTALNIAVPESVSVSAIAALVTWLVVFSFCATKAARDDVTTSRAIRMKVSAKADSWIARLLRERPRRGCACTTVDRGPFELIPLYRASDPIT